MGVDARALRTTAARRYSGRARTGTRPNGVEADRCRCCAACRSTIPAAAAIGPRDDLEQMAIWIFEVDAASAVMVVNLACLGARRIGPILETPLSHPTKDLVELRFANQKGIMLRR